MSSRREDIGSKSIISVVRRLYGNGRSEEDYILISDYIDSLMTVASSFDIDAKSVMGDVMDVTIRAFRDNSYLYMNYDEKRRRFFRDVNMGIIGNNFYDEKSGMFIIMGMVEYATEIMIHSTGETKMRSRNQMGVALMQGDRRVYSPLREYQYNGSILMLICLVMDINIRRLVGLGFKRDGRGLFKKLFDGLDGLYGRSEDFLYQLEKVYAINELVKAGYGERLKGDAIMITMANGKDKFKGNLKLEGELMDKLEMILSDAYIRNHEEMEVMGNYNRVNSYLTSAKSRGYFMKRIGNVSDVIRNEGSGKKAKKRSVMPAVFFIVGLVLIMVMVVVVMFYGGFLGK